MKIDRVFAIWNTLETFFNSTNYSTNRIFNYPIFRTLISKNNAIVEKIDIYIFQVARMLDIQIPKMVYVNIFGPLFANVNKYSGTKRTRYVQEIRFYFKISQLTASGDMIFVVTYVKS